MKDKDTLIIPGAPAKKTIVGSDGTPLGSANPEYYPRVLVIGFVFDNKISGEPEFSGVALVPFSLVQEAAKKARLGDDTLEKQIHQEAILNIYAWAVASRSEEDAERVKGMSIGDLVDEISKKYDVRPQPPQIAHSIVDMTDWKLNQEDAAGGTA